MGLDISAAYLKWGFWPSVIRTFKQKQKNVVKYSNVHVQYGDFNTHMHLQLGP